VSAPVGFYCLDDGVPAETVRLLASAAARRSVPFFRLAPALVDPRHPPLAPGSLLFSPSTSALAERVEQQLWQPGVASFYRRPEGPFVVTVNPLLAFVRAGLPVPRFLSCTTSDRDELASFVQTLGGLPVVVKTPGGEGGVGTMRADSLPALYSLIDLLVERGPSVLLMTYVPEALHIRLVVVGDRVVTAYRNPLRPDDFRSEPSADPADYDIPVEAEWSAVALKACATVGYAFGGVDLLVHPSGRVYLLEANFPCYFPQGQRDGGPDIALAMVDFLLAQRPAS
jgi:hypothetical protein